MKRLSLWFEKTLESPGWKTMFFVVMPVIAGVLSGTFVSEITDAKGLQWSLFYKAWSFYGLVLLVIIIYFYNRAVYLHEIEIMKFSDADFCVAYMRSKCLPEAAEKYKEKIRNGEGGELLEVMAELKKILK